ncbi:MAG: hypothetical protein CME88_07295 [Hirschia sp.]|nr:hypothetical protein [Hirschia sp.]MBF18166.1 hypothetical protein [Hirschia sp.]
MRYLVSLFCLALFATSSAVADSSVGSFRIDAAGKTVRECRSATLDKAESTAWTRALRASALPTNNQQCMKSAKPDAVSVKYKQTDYPMIGRCVVQYVAGYDRRELLEASRVCSAVSDPIPIGVLLRADVNNAQDDRTAKAAIGYLTTALERNNFKIINLSQFEHEIQGLSLVEQCAFTGEQGAQKCQKSYDDYMLARDAMASRLRRAIGEYKDEDEDLGEWSACGGMLIIGEIAINADDDDMNATINTDFISLNELATPIAPFSEEITGAVDLGGVRAAVSDASAQLVAATARDATQKLANFAHEQSCSLR